MEGKIIKFVKDCQLLRIENKKLLKEKETLHDKLDHAENPSRKFSDGAQRLQKELEVFRELLQDNDIDKAEERIAHLEDCSRPCFLTSRRGVNLRIDHSPGSILDSDNASSGGSDIDLKMSKSDDGQMSNSIGGVLRCSARLIKHNGSSSSNVHAGFWAKSVTARKRKSADSTDSYHDIDFKMITPGDTEHSEREMDATNVSLKADDFETHSNASSFRTPRQMATGNRLTRLHNFVSISSLRLQMCSCCGKRFALGRPALRCKICRLVVHENCQRQLKQRCVPPVDFSPSPSRVGKPRTPLSAAISRRHLGASTLGRSPATGTPSFTNKHRVFAWHSISLDSLCPPNEFPHIPSPVIHCVNEVAARGLLQLGIYRVPGAERKVFELLDKFMLGRATPSLALVEDINVVCSCLKAFLRLLSEPLVTYALRPDFIDASELSLRNPEGAKYRVGSLMDKLPLSNRDTLAFVILHLKAVSRSPMCRMGEANLAKVFGYTLVGHSCPEPSLTQAANEVNGQQSVVRLLLSVPDALYFTFVA